MIKNKMLFVLDVQGLVLFQDKPDYCGGHPPKLSTSKEQKKMHKKITKEVEDGIMVQFSEDSKDDILSTSKKKQRMGLRKKLTRYLDFTDSQKDTIA